eukprot:contig_11472_g2739
MNFFVGYYFYRSTRPSLWATNLKLRRYVARVTSLFLPAATFARFDRRCLLPHDVNSFTAVLRFKRPV